MAEFVAEQAADVGMLEGGGGLPLAHQSRLRLPAVVVQDLDGDLAVEARIVGGVDGAHATLPDRALDLVRTETGAGRQPAGRGHRPVV